MAIQILPLVLIRTCCLVGIRSIAARSRAVGWLRIPSPRHHVTRRPSAVLPPTPLNVGKLRAGVFARRAFYPPKFFAAAPAVNQLAGRTSTDYRRSFPPGET
jgi:hypothetical protein